MVLLWAGLGAGVLFVAAALTVAAISPDNALPSVLYIVGGLLAFIVYKIGGIVANRESSV